jgi:hypothetical protein
MGCSISKKVAKPASPPASLDQSDEEEELEETTTKIYVALYDYESGTNEVLSFEAKDHLEILDDTTVLKGSIPI